jgi:hypothetical protein
MRRLGASKLIEFAQPAPCGSKVVGLRVRVICAKPSGAPVDRRTPPASQRARRSTTARSPHAEARELRLRHRRSAPPPGAVRTSISARARSNSSTAGQGVSFTQRLRGVVSEGRVSCPSACPAS